MIQISFFETSGKNYACWPIKVAVITERSLSIYAQKNPFGKRNQSFQYRGDKTTCKRESRDCISALFIVEQELKNEIVREIPTGIQKKMIETVYTPNKNKWITPAMNLFIQILRKDQKENCRFKY